MSSGIMRPSGPTRPLVIIPTYNECANIASLIRKILSLDGRLHILVIDDNSPDHTAAAVSRLKKDYPGRLFLQSRPAKLGLGSAYIQGFKWGIAEGYDFMVQMDGDWSHNPEDLLKMLELARHADFVIGSRYVQGGKTSNWGIGRRFLSRSASIYSRHILTSNFADFTGGFNGWSRELLQAVDLDALRSDGYSFQIELKYLAARLGYSHIEFPITFTERRGGKSKMSFSIALEACWRVWKFRLDYRKNRLEKAHRSDPEHAEI